MRKIDAETWPSKGMVFHDYMNTSSRPSHLGGWITRGSEDMFISPTFTMFIGLVLGDKQMSSLDDHFLY